jgi:hypothetical protein
MEIQVIEESFGGMVHEGDKHQKPALMRFDGWIYFLDA